MIFVDEGLGPLRQYSTSAFWMGLSSPAHNELTSWTPSGYNHGPPRRNDNTLVSPLKPTCGGDSGSASETATAMARVILKVAVACAVDQKESEFDKECKPVPYGRYAFTPYKVRVLAH